MKKCITCGKELPCDARFCYVCGTAVREVVAPVENEEIIVSTVIKRESSKDEKSSSFVVNETVISNETTDEERQAILDKMRSRLKGERALWLIGAIFSIVVYVSLWFGLFSSVVYMSISDPYDYEVEYYEEEPYYYDEYETEISDIEITAGLLVYGVVLGFYIFVPGAVFGFIMAAKAKKCLKTLYRDCSYSHRRCLSPSIIIFAAIFNPWCLIFTIPLFCIARNNSRLLKEIAEIQYNYYTYNPDVTNTY